MDFPYLNHGIFERQVSCVQISKSFGGRAANGLTSGPQSHGTATQTPSRRRLSTSLRRRI